MPTEKCLLPIIFVTLTSTMPRNVSELSILHCCLNVAMSNRVVHNQ